MAVAAAFFGTGHPAGSKWSGDVERFTAVRKKYLPLNNLARLQRQVTVRHQITKASDRPVHRPGETSVWQRILFSLAGNCLVTSLAFALPGTARLLTFAHSAERSLA